MSNSPDTIKGSEVLASALADAKIKTIFTLAGGHFLPTYEAIGSQKRIEIIDCQIHPEYLQFLSFNKSIQMHNLLFIF